MDREGVAGLGALDVERAGLGVEEGEVADLRRQVVDAADLPVEAVLGVELEDRAGPDPSDRAAPPKVQA